MMKPRLLTYGDKTLSIVDWARKLNVSPRAMYNRVHGNVVPERMFAAEQQPRERLKHDLDFWQREVRYDPDTGKFFRGARELRLGGKGNVRIAVEGHRVRASQVAWALMNGAWAAGNVYPLDGDVLNLRYANLRLRDEDRYDTHGKVNAKTRHGYGLVHRYGIRRVDYDAMLVAQHGVCACCSKQETQRGRTGKIKPLHVDHDHETGEVRALLCAHCNWMIGLADDQTEVLRLGIDYLARHKRSKFSVITSNEAKL